MRVLVVEDELRMASLIRRGLVHEGLAADVTANGEDALWMARAHDYDAIVLDVMLPGADGFDVCRRLRDAGVWSPVLMLTARDSVDDRVHGLDSGADDYLVKPFAFAGPLLHEPLLSARELGSARRAPLYLHMPPVPGLDEGSRLLATAVTRNHRPAVPAVGATEQNDAETLASFRDELLIAGPIALVLASVVGYLLAGLSLRQVESMRRRAAVISAETPGERLPVPPTGDEVQRLGETLNEMLDRLEEALQRERDFVADAGHELRTPLALLRTELELALRQATTEDELREAVRWSSYEADRLSQLAEDLLLIARTERGKLPCGARPLRSTPCSPLS